jgi:cobalamin biosynthesis protein CobD/CbiB
MSEQPTTPDPAEQARLLVEAVNRRDLDALQAHVARAAAERVAEERR